MTLEFYHFVWPLTKFENRFIWPHVFIFCEELLIVDRYLISSYKVVCILQMNSFNCPPLISFHLPSFQSSFVSIGEYKMRKLLILSFKM